MSYSSNLQFPTPERKRLQYPDGALPLPTAEKGSEGLPHDILVPVPEGVGRGGTEIFILLP